MKTDLTVKGESIERIYGQYLKLSYNVNRRYQRKLVWSEDEKIAFIDSISRNYPVPIILLAENKTSAEILDGMQRMNAIFSFINGEFPLNGMYFDLSTMATTLELRDTGVLEQKLPMLDREFCVKLTGYEISVSIFEFNTEDEVDDVFRRINSGGKNSQGKN